MLEKSRTFLAFSRILETLSSGQEDIDGEWSPGSCGENNEIFARGLELEISNDYNMISYGSGCRAYGDQQGITNLRMICENGEIVEGKDTDTGLYAR